MVKNFKKVLIALLVALTFSLASCSDETEISTSAIMFTRPECTYCQNAIAYFNVLKKEHQELSLDVRDLSIGDNRDLLKAFARKNHLEGQRAMTPIIFTPKGYMFGWDDDSPKKLEHLLNFR